MGACQIAGIMQIHLDNFCFLTNAGVNPLPVLITTQHCKISSLMDLGISTFGFCG